jgi:hypothetical protein
MKRRNSLLLASLAFILISLVGSAAAQRSDRDNPIALTANEISGSLNNHNEERFYSFTAGPGQLTVTMDVKARTNDIGNMSFELLGKNGSDSILCCEGAQGDGGGTGRDVKSVNLTKRQTVILHTTNGPVGGGTYRIRLDGPAFFSGSSEVRSGINAGDGGERGRMGRGGNQIDVPASGTLRIKMKNGSTKEIDLSLVENISVRP